MKKFGFVVIISFVLISNAFSSQRKVLIEMFTNAHCYACVAAYELFRQYNSTNPLSQKTSFVFYHITQPGVEDSIYFENRSESDTRNIYYGSHNTAPLLFMDGAYVGSNIKTWQQYIETKFSTESPFDISISGTKNGDDITIQTSVKKTGTVLENDLRLHVLLTESVETYIGKNGVTPQVYAMRKMLTGASGESFSVGLGETKTIIKSGLLKPHWIKEKMFVVAFVQSVSKKTIYQSEMQSVTFFTPTSVNANNSNNSTPTVFQLEQNYPNPFNPTTVINYQLPVNSFVTLKVYDLLGREVATLVNEHKVGGRYSVRFDGSNLSAGTYIYKLSADKFSDVKKIVLIK